jgi:hypothetical protein
MKGNVMTSKKILKALESLGLQYEDLLTQEKVLGAKKSAVKEEINGILQEIKENTVDVDRDAEKPLRIKQIINTSIVYNVSKLKKLIKTKGKEAYRTAFEVKLNNAGLEELFSTGVVNQKEIKKCIDKIAQSKPYIKVQRVKHQEIKNEL